MSPSSAESALSGTSTSSASDSPAKETGLSAVFGKLAFLFSAVLSPYIVIPVGTLAIVYARSSPGDPALLWALVSVFFSTVVPAAYVVWGMKRGKITDVHVMEREQRSGPFFVAVVSSFISALVLWAMHAPISVWGLSLVVAINGVVLWAITSYWKISVHVSVLSSVTLAAVTLHPGFPPQLFLLVPALIWARLNRRRHTLSQGLAGCIVACLCTALTLISLDMGVRLQQLFQRIFQF